MILSMTWRNLWRNRRRTLITLTSICFAVLLSILMQSFQKGVFGNLVKNVVGFYYGYVQVHRSGYWEEQVLDNGMELTDSLMRSLERTEAVRVVVPRLESFMLASFGNSTRGCMLAGTDPLREDQLTGLSSRVVSGRYFLKGEPSVLLSEGLARKIGIRLNDTIVLLGQGYQGSLAAGKYPVCGILHFGSPALNDALLFIPLESAQELLSTGPLATSISIGLPDPALMNAVQQNLSMRLGDGFEVMNWKEMMPEIANHIRADSSSFYVFTGILYLIIAFGLFGTLIMMTAERRNEFGLLISIGMKKRLLATMLLMENLAITLMGLAAGIVLSLPLVVYFRDHPPRLTGEMASVYESFGFEPLFPTVIDGQILFTQSAIILGISLIIGTYPFWHILTLDPLKARKR